jgi:hypothetical protein
MVDPVFWRNVERKGDGRLVPMPGKRPTLVFRKAADVAPLDAGADMALTALDLGDDLDLGGVALLVQANQDLQDYVNTMKAALETQVNAMQTATEAYVNALKEAVEADSATRRAAMRVAGLMR